MLDIKNNDKGANMNTTETTTRIGTVTTERSATPAGWVVVNDFEPGRQIGGVYASEAEAERASAEVGLPTMRPAISGPYLPRHVAPVDADGDLIEDWS